MRAIGLIRRACGGEQGDEGDEGDGSRNEIGGDGRTRRKPPPRIAFELALQVCVLCARPDAGLEVLSLMQSAGLKPPIEAFKVGLKLEEKRKRGFLPTMPLYWHI